MTSHIYSIAVYNTYSHQFSKSLFDAASALSYHVYVS